MGTSSFVEGFAKGVGGVITEPIKETQKNGLKGLPIGVAKGLGGLVGKPIKGTFDLIA